MYRRRRKKSSKQNMPIIITMINLIPDFNILSHEAQLFACFTHKESWQLLHVMWRRLLELFRWHPFLIPSWAVRPRLSILHYPLLPSEAKRRREHYYSTNVTIYSLQPTQHVIQKDFTSGNRTITLFSSLNIQIFPIKIILV